MGNGFQNQTSGSQPPAPAKQDNSERFEGNSRRLLHRTSYTKGVRCVYLDLPTVTNFCLFIQKISQKAEIWHSWKIQVYTLAFNVEV